MASQDRAERLRQAIVGASARLEVRPVGLQKSIPGPAPGDLYVFETPVDGSIEWLVVRYHVDDPETVLLAPADDLPLAGQCDVGLWPEFLDRPLTVRCGESAWVPATLCADYLRVASVPEEAVSEVRRVIAALARGTVNDDPVREHAEADPEYMAWLDEVRVARQSLEDRAELATIAASGAVLELDDFSTTPPAWLAAEPNHALAAAPGGELMTALAESLESEAPRYTEVPLRSSGRLFLTADASGVRVGWRGPEGAAPPTLAGFGKSGKQTAAWSNGEQTGFHRAEPAFAWRDGQVILQAGGDNPENITVRL